MHCKLQSTSYIVVNRFPGPSSHTFLDRSFQFLQFFFPCRVNSIANIFNFDLLAKAYWWLVSMLQIYFSLQSSFICIHELVDLSSGDVFLKCYTSLELRKKAINFNETSFLRRKCHRYEIPQKTDPSTVSCTFWVSIALSLMISTYLRNILSYVFFFHILKSLFIQYFLITGFQDSGSIMKMWIVFYLSFSMWFLNFR